jgi:hypothetical protein
MAQRSPVYPATLYCFNSICEPWTPIRNVPEIPQSPRSGTPSG